MAITEQGLLEREKDTMTLNMGPQHPSTHGVFRMVLEMDGEIVLSSDPDIGFLHTGIEKTAEAKRYVHCIPMTDRLDYLSPPQNNLAFCLTVEKLLGLNEMPARADYLRVIMVELGRIGSHLVWLGTHGRSVKLFVGATPATVRGAVSMTRHLSWYALAVGNDGECCLGNPPRRAF